MSYDVEFQIDGKVVEFKAPHQVRGGTYQMGGTTEAHLNITYNYGAFFEDAFGEDGIRALYGLRAEQVIPLLETAVKKLGNERGSDYWAATPGNAGAALSDLLIIARGCPPDAVLEGD